MKTTVKIGLAAVLFCVVTAQQSLAQCPAALQATVDWSSESVPTSVGSGVLTYTATVPVGSGPATIDVIVDLSPAVCFSERLWKRTESNAHNTGSHALNYKTNDALGSGGCATSTVRYTFDHPDGVSKVSFSVLDVDDDTGTVWDDIITVTATDGTTTYTPSSAGSSYSIVDPTNVSYNGSQFVVIGSAGNIGNTASNGNITLNFAQTSGQGITSADIVHAPQGDGRIGLGDITFCVDAPLPVELTSFDAAADGQDVLLRWETASETNNAGFYVEMAAHDQNAAETHRDFRQLGFIEGYGTIEHAQSYQYRVRDLDPGAYTFRLKQIDYDGTFEYHPEVEAHVSLPTAYFLSAAYPNPFNPQAQFRLSVAQRQQVRVDVYNALGQRVAHLFEGTMEADVARTFTIDGNDLQSGVYLYRVVGDAFSESRPVMLIK